MLDNCRRDGCWGPDDFESWAPIITALSVELFLACGIKVDDAWVAGPKDQTFTCTLRSAIDFLNGRIIGDGSFGEDLWDAVRFALVILQYDLASFIPRYDILFKYIDSCVERGDFRRRQATWDGPGVLCALILFYQRRGDSAKSSILFHELEDLQASTGEFHGTLAEDGTELASPVWHTAQALMVYLSRGLSERDERVAKIVAWLQRSQSSEGNWRGFSRYEVYFTSYAIIALASLSNPPKHCTEKALTWLNSQIGPSGRAGDTGGTLMAAMAFCAASDYTFMGVLRGVEYHNARRVSEIYAVVHNELQDIKQQLTIKTSQLALFENKFGEADFGLSTKQAFLWGILVAAIFAGLGLLGPEIVKAVFENPTIQTQLNVSSSAHSNSEMLNGSSSVSFAVPQSASIGQQSQQQAPSNSQSVTARQK